MSSGTSLINSFYVMLISITFAYLLNVGLGYAMDSMLMRFAAAGVYNVPGEYNPTSMISFVCNLFHLLMYVVPIFGVGQSIYTAVRRQRYDSYERI